VGSKRNGVTWKPQSSHSKVENRVVAPGPGTYNADKSDIFPIYKYKPSSVFASKAGRTTQPNFNPSQSRQSLPPKPQSQHAAMRETEDLFEEDDDEEVSSEHVNECRV